MHNTLWRLSRTNYANSVYLQNHIQRFYLSEPLRTLQIPSAIYHTSPVNDDKCAVSFYDIQQECRGFLFICNVDQVPSFSNLISDLIYL